MSLPRILIVAAIVGTVVIAFAGAGGWFSPHAVTASRVVDTFEQVNGPHPGFRRNHAKGIGLRGTFVSNGAGERLSKVVVFKSGSYPVTGRFALAGGLPYVADSAAAVRSMALRFTLPDGEEWRTGMNDIPVFAVRTAEEMRDQLLATAPDPATGKPNPDRVKAFFEGHPASAKALALIKQRAPTTGFADDTYWGLNTFFLVSADGAKHAVRWSMVPDAANGSAAPPEPDAGTNVVFDALIARVHQGPLAWHLKVTLAKESDVLDDATVAWPSDRETVDVGTLTVDAVESENGHEVRILNFDPLILPAGIEPSADPILSARSGAYAESARRRLGEPEPESAVSPTEVSR